MSKKPLLTESRVVLVLAPFMVMSVCMAQAPQSKPPAAVREPVFVPPPSVDQSAKVKILSRVPIDVTSEELCEFVKKRQPTGTHPELEAIAQLYPTYGEGGPDSEAVYGSPVRWDWAFFQMIQETGWCTSTKAIRQNNFAGIGAATKDRATGDAAEGDSFDDVALGVKAHLQHLAVYGGVNYFQAKAKGLLRPDQELVAKRTKEIHNIRVGKSPTFAGLSGTWCTYPWDGQHYAWQISHIAHQFGTRYQGNLTAELTQQFQQQLASMKDQKVDRAEFKTNGEVILVTRRYKNEARFISATSERGNDKPVIVSFVLRTRSPGDNKVKNNIDVKLTFSTSPMKYRNLPNGIIEGSMKVTPTGNVQLDLLGGGGGKANAGEQTMTWRLETEKVTESFTLGFVDKDDDDSKAKPRFKPLFTLKHVP